ncbi:hypothetical protein EGK75_00910 [Neisseria weixii]|uniref:Uncharacterized protein n=1 Tax=Neisseria weixii TaxID=1853276 RepID=A0A3N4N758_9NEIS|nr:hypothetical protein CGZ65_12270 [Neisseria weixii]RPD90938.1 hypothetical protein EGK74_00905 [Neisseria weixii]RPD91132.1 hypothetical protein EGK75_00910 [Neisseria weixii]
MTAGVRKPAIVEMGTARRDGLIERLTSLGLGRSIPEPPTRAASILWSVTMPMGMREGGKLLFDGD